MRAYICIEVDEQWTKKEFEKYIKKWIEKTESEGLYPYSPEIPEQVDISLIQIKDE
jgi:hypothetical protein